MNNSEGKDTEPRTTLPSKEAVVSYMEESSAIIDAVKDKLRERVSRRLSIANDATIKAKSAFATFSPSKRSPGVAEGSTYWVKGSNLGELQREIIRQDIERIKEDPAKGGIRVSASSEAAADLKLSVAEDGMVTSALTDEEILRYVERIDLSASSDLIVECHLKKEVDERINEITGSGGTTPAHPSPGDSSESDASTLDPTLDTASAQLVRDKVTLQIENATSPEAMLRFGEPARADQHDVLESTRAFRLEGGPADVTAYHDFFDLQIAFRHVWMEVFDAELAEMGQALYEEWVNVTEELGIHSDLGAITTVEELMKAKDELRKLRTQIVEAAGELARPA